MDSYADQDFFSIACGKLIVNLVNAPNALSGCSTRTMFTQYGYKRVWAQAITEAMAVMLIEGITVRSPRDLENGKIRNLHLLLSLPTWVLNLYLTLSGRQLDGKTSMLQDLEANRGTEIDYLTGYISKWGKLVNVPTPVSDSLVALVKKAEADKVGSPNMSPEALLQAAGLR